MDNSSNFSMRQDSYHSVTLITATKWVLPLCALAMSSLTGVFAPSAAQAQATQPSAYSTATRYDAVGRVTGTIAPDPDGSGPLGYLAIRNTYDDRGLPITQESGELATWQSDSVAPDDWSGFTVVVTAHTAYDAMGRKTREWSVGGGSTAIQTMTQYSYDAVGRLECTAVRMKPSKFNNLPDGACTDSDANASPPDRITKTIYDAADQVKQVRKAVGTPLEQAYATYDYTPNGQQKYVIDANGNKAEMVYDGHDRRERWSFPSKTKPTSYNDATVASALTSAGAVSTTDYEAYTYDDNGNILTKRKRDGQVIGFTYDRLNRVSKKDIPGGTAQDVHYGYDLRGLQVYARFGNASGNGIETVYDGFGRISETTNKMFATPRSLSYEYDQNGNRTKITHPGSNGQANGAFFTYEYDKLDRLTVVREQGSAVLLTQSYDNRGHRAATSRTNATTSYDYDLIGRLASLNTNVNGTAEDNLFSFAYSPASQMKNLGISNKLYEHTAHYNIDRQYTTNGLNQYTAAGLAAFTYDDNGNLTGDGDTVYAYDIENRLVTARGKKEANLIYDPMGRLFETNANSNLTQTTTQFLYDGDALVAEYDDAGNMLHRYVHGSGVDEPMVWYIGATVGAATRSHLHANWQGSITAVTDASGDTQWVNGYDPYGIPNWKNAGRFQYTGQIMIPELEMYHYKARLYSPTMGRFLQTDPIGYEDQVNLYAYVGNDPINAIDPTGKNALKLFIKRTIKHRGNVVEAAIDVADTAVTVIAPSSTLLERGIAIAELVSPVAPSDVKAIRNGIEAAGGALGGRKGNAATRAQNEAIGNRIENQGGTVTGGFNQGRETRFAGPNGGNRGSRFSDGSAADRDGNEFQVQTVDTRADGSLTTREANAARDIAERSGQPVICVAKERCN